jgi:hypothetical protein
MTSIKDKLGYIPSHKTDGKYVTLMETSGEENESWIYFIRLDGNEENLQHLQNQFDQVEWYIIDDLSTFDLDIDHPVSAQTAKEMTKVDLNHTSFHRKFDGVLQKVDLGYTKKDGNDTKICKTFDILGYGQIENFIDDEDLDEEDLVSDDESGSSVSESESESESEEEISKVEEINDDEEIKKIEPALKNLLKKKMKR